MTELGPGDALAGHTIEGIAGRGTMGVVYRAREHELDREMALKVIAGLTDDEDRRRRIVRAAETAAAVEHPNLVRVDRAGEHDGLVYIVMRYVDGPDLRTLVRGEGSLDQVRAARIVAQVADGLDAVHGHGLVHRNVKPTNVLIGRRDHAYLSDLGLGRLGGSSGGGRSRVGGLIGTLGYVAPEQIRGEPVDARTDVYALGCVLVYALTGSAPFGADSDEAMLSAHLEDPPSSEGLAAEFADVITRAMAKDPADRYATAGDLGDAVLHAAGLGPPPDAGGLAQPGETADMGAEDAGRRDLPPPPERDSSPAPATPAAEPEPPGGASPAPGAGSAEPETATSAGAAPTRVPAPRPSGRRAPPARGRRRRPPPERRWRALGAGAVAVVAVVAAVVLLAGGDDDAATPEAPGAPPPARVDITRQGILTRPNALTVVGDEVWALSGRDGAIAIVDAATGDLRAARVNVGAGASSLAAGFGSVWVTKTSTASLLRIDASTRRRAAGGPIRIRGGRNVAVTTGEGAVWVGVRNRADAHRGPEAVVRVDPRTGAQRRIPVPGGVQDLAVGAGAVWVSNRYDSTVTRIGVQDGGRDVVRVGRGPRGIAAGPRAIWVAASEDMQLVRIEPSTLETRAVDLESAPERVAVGGGSVWATARDADRLIRVDPEALAVTDRVPTGDGPFALDAAGDGSAWLTLLEADGVQRVGF